jgi:hypothetical protein
MRALIIRKVINATPYIHAQLRILCKQRIIKVVHVLHTARRHLQMSRFMQQKRFRLDLSCELRAEKMSARHCLSENIKISSTTLPETRRAASFTYSPEIMTSI